MVQRLRLQVPNAVGMDSIPSRGTKIPLLLLLLSRFSRVRLCATPSTAAHQPSPSLGFSRQEHWSGFSSSNAWKWKVKVKSLSRVRLLATPWTAAYQASLSMGFSRQKYWSGVPLPSLRSHYYGQKNFFKKMVNVFQLFSKVSNLLRVIHWAVNWGFHGGSDGKASACNVGDPGSIPGSERSPEEGNGNPL